MALSIYFRCLMIHSINSTSVFLKSIVLGLVIFNFSPSNAVDSKPPLNIITLTFPPYSFSESGQIKGISVEIIEKIFGHLNIPVTIELLPWSRAIRNMRLGASDGIFQLLHKPERTEFLDYCDEPLIEERVNLYVPADSTLNYSGNIQDLKDYWIGIRQDFSYGPIFDQAKQEGLFKHTDKTTVLALLLLLKHKKIEAIVGDQYGIPLTLKKHKKKLPEFTIKTFQSPIDQQLSYFAFSKKKGHSAICQRFNKQLKSMKANGEYKALIDKWSQGKP
jgi:polar amino acid transport system substrate-binding protein